MADMKTADRITVTGIFPLFDQGALMVGVAPDLGRGWLGPVVLRSGDREIALRCVGVGETGTEPTVMLRPTEPGARAIAEIIAAVAEQPGRPLYLERPTARTAT